MQNVSNKNLIIFQYKSDERKPQNRATQDRAPHSSVPRCETNQTTALKTSLKLWTPFPLMAADSHRTNAKWSSLCISRHQRTAPQRRRRHRIIAIYPIFHRWASARAICDLNKKILARRRGCGGNIFVSSFPQNEREKNEQKAIKRMRARQAHQRRTVISKCASSSICIHWRVLQKPRLRTYSGPDRTIRPLVMSGDGTYRNVVCARGWCVDRHLYRGMTKLERNGTEIYASSYDRLRAYRR